MNNDQLLKAALTIFTSTTMSGQNEPVQKRAYNAFLEVNGTKYGIATMVQMAQGWKPNVWTHGILSLEEKLVESKDGVPGCLGVIILESENLPVRRIHVKFPYGIGKPKVSFQYTIIKEAA